MVGTNLSCRPNPSQRTRSCVVTPLRALRNQKKDPVATPRQFIFYSLTILTCASISGQRRVIVSYHLSATAHNSLASKWKTIVDLRCRSINSVLSRRKSASAALGSRHMLSLCKIVPIVVSLFTSFAFNAGAQEITGSVSGRITDKSGAAVVNANVTVINTDKNDAVVRVITKSRPRPGHSG
jgi:hypothetical protein